jgi:hypothetical protein
LGDDRRVRVWLSVAGMLCAVAAMAGAGVASSAGPFEPSGELTCAFDPAAHELRLDYGSPGGGPDQAPMAWIYEAGGTIRVNEDLPGLTRISCGPVQPTTRNTDTIVLTAAVPLRGSETYITAGPNGLGPGATPEPGGDEIEITADLGPGAMVHAFGSRAADDWTYGSRGADRHAVNFNVHEGRPDADLEIIGAGQEISANVEGGANRVSAMGGAGTGGPLKTGIELIAMDGNDRLVGGPGDDDLVAYAGNDVLIGGPGDDHLDDVGGRGHDRLVCGPGHDRYRSSGKDRVRCGGDRGFGAGR